MAWGAVAAAAISGIMQNKAAKKAASAQTTAAELAYDRSLPGRTTGLFGTAGFSGKDATLDLSPDLQGVYDRLRGRADTVGEQISQYSADPFLTQKKLFEQQQKLFMPAREKERLSREARLLQQGKRFSTGGIDEIESAETSYGMQDLARQIAAFDQGQGMLSNLRAAEGQDMQKALLLGELPMQYANLSKGISGVTSPAAMFAGEQAGKAATGLGGTQAAFWSQLGQQKDVYNAQGVKTGTQQSPLASLFGQASDYISNYWGDNKAAQSSSGTPITYGDTSPAYHSTSLYRPNRSV